MATVAEIMNRGLATVSSDAPVRDAARLMSETDVGDVIVVEADRLVGILTDRDLAVRVLAADKGPTTPVREACSAQQLVTVTPDTTLDRAVEVMREKTVRRLPVVEHGRVVGVISIGDVAIEHDPRSALADITAADPNR